MPIETIALLFFGITFLSIATMVAYTSTFKPEIFLRWQARFYRHQYKQVLKLSDSQIDRRAPPILFLFLIDSMSQYVNRGPEHPNEFPRLLRYIRAIGCLLWVIVLLATLGFILTLRIRFAS